jgi:aspartyl aminopeptidase
MVEKDNQFNAEIFNTELCAFLDASPSPFHAVASMISMLEQAGFSALDEADDWQLVSGSKHYVVRNGSSIVAFVVGSNDIAQSGLRMVGAHTDSPCLMIKPQPDLDKSGCSQLAVEVYGGALLNPWFDRDLSVAGRLVYKNTKGNLRQKLVNFEQPIAVIPSLAIHLDREANKGRTVNPQTDITPVIGLSNGDKKAQDFVQILQQQFLQAKEQVMDFELCLYDTQPAALIGLDKEFLTSARLDNLLSCFIAARSLVEADHTNTCIIACNDHEEVGSVSAVGADGPFLESVVARIVSAQTKSTHAHVINRSLLISSDNAHAVHPNYPQKHDDVHLPKLNGGPSIKTNVKQRYATNSATASLFKEFCQQANVPVQQFVSRNDMGCGSTIGPITSSRLGVPTVDIGIPQLAMHSCREIIGSQDPLRLSKVLKAFFDTLDLRIEDE